MLSVRCPFSQGTFAETQGNGRYINSAVATPRFLFRSTGLTIARRLTIVREPRRLPAVLSVEEVTLLLQAAPGPKYKAALATAIRTARLHCWSAHNRYFGPGDAEC
jgi:hypothetical protein